MPFNEVCKLMTLRSSSILFEQIKLSLRNKENRIPVKSIYQKESCFHNASAFWNMYIKRLNIPNIHNISIPLLKHKLKTHLLNIQVEGPAEDWIPANTDM